MPGTRCLCWTRWVVPGAFGMVSTPALPAEPVREAASAVAAATVNAATEGGPGFSLFALVGLGLLVVLLGWRWRMRALPQPQAPRSTLLPSGPQVGPTWVSQPASTRADIAVGRAMPGLPDAPDTGPASYAALPEAPAAAPARPEPPSPGLHPAAPEEAWADVLATDSLVDVEQQADFFLALGQDEAAKALLAEALEAAPTPRLHLKLADVLGRHGDREAWEALRLRTEARFNLAMPAWEASPGPDRGLEAHPLALARLVAIWPNPLRAASTLGKSLRRPPAGRPARQRFDLSAYRELMLLHAIACDVARQVAVTEVDIELPFDEERPDAAAAAPSAS